MKRISSEHLSSLQFERVWVREAVFIDNEGDQTSMGPAALEDISIQLEAIATYSEKGDRAFVTLRASLEPPPNRAVFVKLSATVEGAFTVRAGTDPEKIQRFATVQAPVLLMPYLRQLITMLTAQSRLSAIIVPPINMTEITTAMQAKVAAKAEGPTVKTPV